MAKRDSNTLRSGAFRVRLRKKQAFGVGAARRLARMGFNFAWVASPSTEQFSGGFHEICNFNFWAVLMLAGKIDFHMGGDMLQAFNAVKEGIPVVAVAAIFQKHPQVILAHPGVAESWDDLKDLTLLIGDNGFTSYYQWMIAEHGFTAEQRQPYTFNPAPFIADTQKGMQGYLSYEPYAVEKEAGFNPNTFLITDAG